MGDRTYESAGVSLDLAESVVERLRAAVESTGTKGFGGFAGLYPLGEDRFLAATTDSVGTKLMLARRAGRLRGAGMDLAAHCANDIVCVGADPLFFLDYVAANSLSLDEVAELVEGLAEVCRAAGCAILGGETAELPGIYQEGELDFVGTCVGLVEGDRVIDGSRCEAGDVVLGIASSGLHTNGYSLVRKLIGDGDFDADLLLAPHRLYVEEVRALRAATDVKALAHVTGGGILGNLTRVLPDGSHGGDRLGLVAAAAGIRLAGRARRARRGAAPCLQHGDRHVRRRAGARRARRVAADRAAGLIGVLVSGEGSNLQALIDEGLPIAAVASNKPGVRALERATAAGIPAEVFNSDGFPTREERDAAMADWLAARGVRLVVCAGYMHLLRAPFLERFQGRIVNTHSAPLPDFPGAHPIEDVLAAGVKETAATVHYVDEGVDTGPVIAAVPVPVEEGDTVATLRARVQAAEHRLLPKAVRELIA